MKNLFWFAVFVACYISANFLSASVSDNESDNEFVIVDPSKSTKHRAFESLGDTPDTVRSLGAEDKLIEVDNSDKNGDSVDGKKFYQRRIFRDDRLSTALFCAGTALPTFATTLGHLNLLSPFFVCALNYSGMACGILCVSFEYTKIYYSKKIVDTPKFSTGTKTGNLLLAANIQDSGPGNRETESEKSLKKEMEELIKKDNLEEIKELEEEKKFYQRRIFEDDRISTSIYALGIILPAVGTIVSGLNLFPPRVANTISYSGTGCGLICAALESIKIYYTNKIADITKKEDEILRDN